MLTRSWSEQVVSSFCQQPVRSSSQVPRARGRTSSLASHRRSARRRRACSLRFRSSKGSASGIRAGWGVDAYDAEGRFVTWLQDRGERTIAEAIAVDPRDVQSSGDLGDGPTLRIPQDQEQAIAFSQPPHPSYQLFVLFQPTQESDPVGVGRAAAATLGDGEHGRAVGRVFVEAGQRPDHGFRCVEPARPGATSDGLRMGCHLRRSLRCRRRIGLGRWGASVGPSCGFSGFMTGPLSRCHPTVRPRGAPV